MLRALILAGAAATCAVLALVATTLRPSAGGAGAVDGAALFTAKGCATCHDGPGSTAGIGFGPSLSDAPSWAADRIEGMTAAEYVEQSIRSPSAFISPAWPGPTGPSTGMPVLRLSDAEIDALVDYLLQRSAAAA